MSDDDINKLVKLFKVIPQHVCQSNDGNLLITWNISELYTEIEIRDNKIELMEEISPDEFKHRDIILGQALGED